MATTLYCPRCLNTFADDGDACANLACGRKRPKQGWGVLLGPGDLLDRHYRITRALAVGGAGLTYLAREVDANGTAQPPDLAIKVLYAARASGPFLRRLANEAQILQELAHDNIVDCRGFVHRQGKEPYLVTLFEPGGSLSEHIETVGPLPPRVAAHVIRQILLALDVAHQRGVVHRDLKPDNVLLREKVERDVVPYIRVADFGIAKLEGGINTNLTKIGTFVGTPEYAAPEQFESQAPTPATDIFAAGGVLWYLLTGQPPVQFTHRADIETSYSELLDQIPPKLPTSDRPEWQILQDCLNWMLVTDPASRWTVHQVLDRIGPLTGTSVEPLDAVQPIGAPPPSAYERRHTLELTDQGSPPRRALPAVTRPEQPAGTTQFFDDEEDEGSGGRDTTWDHHTEDSANALAPAPPPLQPSGGSWLGVGLASILVLLVGGGAVSAAVLVGAAYAFGYFGVAPAPPVEVAAIEVDTRDAALDLSGTTDSALFAERKAIRAALRSIGTGCGTGVGAVRVSVDPDGAIYTAEADPAWVVGDAARCLEQQATSLTVPRTSAQSIQLRAAVRLTGASR